MILSEEQLQRLTGRRRPSAQSKWLGRHGWKFAVNALGRPIVAEAEFNRRLVGRSALKQEPDFGALHGSQTHT